MFIEKDIEKGNSCEYNRLYDDKNYVFYDDTYQGPGYLIVNIKNRRGNKFSLDEVKKLVLL